MTSKETPKTLIKAIENGLDDVFGQDLRRSYMSVVISRHVRDFLSQKFGSAILSSDNDEELSKLKSLWLQITGENLDEPEES